jgi:hypothetical protein
MFNINQGLWTALSEDCQIQFFQRLVDDMGDRYPEEAVDVSDEDFRARVQRAMDRALTYGLTDERTVAGYVQITFELGDSFEDDEDNEWAVEILNAPQMDGNQKIDAINASLEVFEEDVLAEEDDLDGDDETDLHFAAINDQSET